MLLTCLLACTIAPASAVNSEQIIILVDQSKSVDDTNRNEALQLVAALMEGREWDPTLWQPDDKAARHMKLAASGLAAEKFTCLAAAVGNYTNVASLRQMLQAPESFQRSLRPMQAWLESKEFFSTDNSTHLTLAQAVVAGSTILKNSSKPYYLMVISDFKEDCLNRPLSDYEPEAYKQLVKQNNLVLQGKLAYNDGPAGTGNYSSADISLIKEYEEKIASDEDSLIGTFRYTKSVIDGKRPVELRLFAPSFRRVFAADSTKEALLWNVVEMPPELGIQHKGFSGDEMISLKINGKPVSEISINDWESSDPWEILLDKAQDGNWKIGEATTISLSVPENILTQKMLTTGFTITPIMPTLSIDTADVEKSTASKPFLLSSKNSLSDAVIDFSLDPEPAEWQASVKVPGSVRKAKACKGSIKISDFMDETEEEVDEDDDPSQKIKLQIDVKHHFPFDDREIQKIIFLKLPQNQFWVEIDGVRSDATDEKYELPRSRAVTFKATYAGMKNFKWRKPTVIREEDSGNVSDSFTDNNNLDFSEMKPGEYKITAKFEFNGQDNSQTFRVVVPSRTPWMLIVVGVMAAASIGLFVFHFMRR